MILLRTSVVRRRGMRMQAHDSAVAMVGAYNVGFEVFLICLLGFLEVDWEIFEIGNKIAVFFFDWI